MQQNMRPITKPDLNSIFESMLAIPADVRAKHVNAYLLTGTPEQKLAAAMIKDMPQGAPQAAPAQAPTQTVIDKLASDPGIASLPVAEGMFDEKSMAAGGIVAFDAGGSIYQQLYGQEPDQFGNIIVDNKLVNIRDLQLGESINPVAAKKPLSAQQRVPTSPWKMDIPAGAVSEETKPKSALLDPINWGVPTQQAEIGVPTPLAARPAPAKPMAKEGLGGLPAANKPAPKAAPASDPRLATGKDLGYDLPDIKVNKLTEPAGLSTLDALNQHKQALEDAGIDPDYYSKQADKLTEQKEALKGDKDQAAWMALAKAGFGMAAGKSQFALSNIAEGAGIGLDQYGRDIKDIKADEKLLRAADQKLEDAKYAQSRGDAEKAESLMRERESLIFNTKIKNVEIENAAEMKRAELTADRSKTIATEQGADRRTAMQINANKAINAADINSRERIAALTAGVSLSEKQRATVDKVADNAKAQLKLDIDGGAQYTPQQIQTRLDELTYNGLAQLGIKLPGLAKPAGPAAGALSKPGAGGVRDYIPLVSQQCILAPINNLRVQHAYY